jgi:tRNA-intron endonuclease
MEILANIVSNKITTNSPASFTLYDQSAFGEKTEGKIQYSLTESLFLVEIKKIKILEKNKNLSFEELEKKFSKIDKKIAIKYAVYKDLRKKGYIPKTALKFGADFRVYKKSSKIGKDHSKWIVFADSENNKLSWQDFSGKNRIAHSTKKTLLLAIVDEEQSVSYYEVDWKKI